jgi:hypothetical protein
MEDRPEPGYFVMERGVLRGIKKRAERGQKPAVKGSRSVSWRSAIFCTWSEAASC